MSIKSFSDGVDQLNDIIPKLVGGISWAMLTFEKDSNEPWKLHVRNNQPCYGEMRKYKVTHGSACTQPEDKRPSDLHHPFPEGTPMAIGVHWGTTISVARETARFLFNPITSPWKVGFKKPEIIENSHILHGVSFYDTAFDPTVFVHALKIFRSVSVFNYPSYTVFREIGLEPYEAVIASQIFGSYRPTSTFAPFYTTGSFTPHFSVKRFKDKNPVDLTGGTLRQRFDYNRKKLSFIFDDENGIDIHKKVSELVGYRNQQNHLVPPHVLRDAVKEILS